jgi:Reverse transcriptase (RNA-dependent DNA polymerase)
METNLIYSNNLGSFYKYVNKKLSSRCGIGSLMREDGSVTNDPREKAEMLNKYLASVFTLDDGVSQDLPSRVAIGEGLSSITFTSSKVFFKLNKLKTGTACGPDGVQAVLLKNASSSLSFSLAQLYQFLFSSSVPKEWKLASVTPIFKKGKPCDVSNYRPISLTSVCCKVMESIIKDELLKYLLSKNLITRHQHGFLARRSTGTQLIDCLNEWTLNIENKQSLDVVYIDFAKAFDSVVHTKLINKLMSYGIGGNLLRWIEDFLTDRY